MSSEQIYATLAMKRIEAQEAEIARLQKALRDIAAIPHMGQYTGSRVNAAIEESRPWSGKGA